MKRLKKFCFLVLIASAVTCALVLWKTSEPITLDEALMVEYGADEYQEVYAVVQSEIANYIVQYGFLTDSWTIENTPVFTENTMRLQAKLKDGTLLNVVYYNDTGECDVETDNSSSNDISTES